MRQKIFTSLLSVLFSVCVMAQTVELNGTTYPSIDSALSVATSGDTIDISGIHTEVIKIDSNDVGVTLMGTDPAVDIIQASADSAGGDDRVLTINKAVTVENLGIQNGNSGNNLGGGIMISRYVTEGTVFLKNVVVKNNRTANKNGGGIAIEGANDVVISHCRITGNVADGSKGGGMVLLSKNSQNASVLISNSIIDNNISYGNGGGIYLTGQWGKDMLMSVDIENTYIVYNQARDGSVGGGAFFKGSPYTPGSGGYGNNGTNNIGISVTNSTVAYNDAYGDNGEGFKFYGEPEFNIFNSIVSLNGDQEGTNTDMNFSGCYTEDAVNNLFGNTYYGESIINNQDNKVGKLAGALKMDTDLSSHGGYHDVIAINGASIAIDSANADYVTDYDIRGYDRNNNRGPDIGAYEFKMPESMTLSAESNSVEAGEAVQLFVDYTPEDADELYIFWEITAGSGGEVENGMFSASSEGEYSLRATAREPVMLASNEITIEVEGELSISELLSDNVSIYPNPAKDIFVIDGVEKVISIEIYSLTGNLEKVVYDNYQADVSGLAQGIYTVAIKTSQGNLVKKLLVQ